MWCPCKILFLGGVGINGKFLSRDISWSQLLLSALSAIRRPDGATDLSTQSNTVPTGGENRDFPVSVVASVARAGVRANGVRVGGLGEGDLGNGGAWGGRGSQSTHYQKRRATAHLLLLPVSKYYDTYNQGQLSRQENGTGIHPRLVKGMQDDID